MTYQPNRRAEAIRLVQEEGAAVPDAAQRAGVSERSLHRWLRNPNYRARRPLMQPQMDDPRSPRATIGGGPGIDDTGGTGLSRRMGGLPAWGWIAIAAAAGIGVILWLNFRKNQAAASSATTFDANSTDASIPTDQYEVLLSQIRDLQGDASQPGPTGPTGPAGPPGPPGPTSPPPVSQPPGHEGPGKHPVVRYYTVQKWPAQGSTLSGIAKIVYGNSNQWPKIFQANITGKAREDGSPGIISNPNSLQPGWKLVIPS